MVSIVLGLVVNSQCDIAGATLMVALCFVVWCIGLGLFACAQCAAL